MKTSTGAWALLAIVLVAAALYWTAFIKGPTPAPSEAIQPTPTTQEVPPSVANTPPVAQYGEHCGGNMRNARVCAEGFHCAQTPGSHLPVGDVGGTCVPDSSNVYAPGNLLLGTDGNPTLGTYLIGGSGMTLYTFSKDTAGVSNCTDTCAIKWPPYIVGSKDALSNLQSGVKGKAGTITRADGTMQVTYNGMPLYFFVDDKKSGDTLGNGVGKVWAVVKP